MFNSPYSARIIVYHQITPDGGGTNYSRSVAQFERDMQYLSSLNIDVISYDQLLDYLDTGFHLKRPAVVIAFDDGLQSDYDYAYPILENYDFPAIFFLIGSRQSTWNNYKTMMLDLRLSGDQQYFVGSHSWDHVKLAYLSRAELRSQFSRSRQAMFDFFGAYPDHLALPFGNGVSLLKVRYAAREAGFRSVRGIIPGQIDEWSGAYHLNSTLIYKNTNLANVIF